MSVQEIEYPFDSFVFYRSFRDAIEEMTDENKLATLLAICDYALYGVEPQLKDAMSRAVFTVARPSIDSNSAKRVGGKKGGRPKKETIGFSSENHRFSKIESTVSESVSESVAETIEKGPDKPPAPPLPETDFGPELQDAFADWLAYKQEKRQEYKPTGLKSLVTQVRRKADAFGEAAVADLIRECMANGWQGIIWDRLGTGPKPGTPRKGEFDDVT